MIQYLLNIDEGMMKYIFIGAFIVTFAVTFLAIKLSLDKLPCDQGRKFAVNGELSKGKPRGGGIVFVIVFALMCVLFAPISAEYLIYYALTIVAMMTGFLDDRSEVPWGELKKGLLDLVICLAVVGTFLFIDGNTTIYFFGGASLTLPPIVYGLIAAAFIWGSINVTNCTDGVDGLLGSLSTVVFAALGAIFFIVKDSSDLMICMIFVGVLLAYLMYNCSPSRLLMGDAGSRAIGLVIAILILKTRIPLIYLLLASVILCDGGSSLLKLIVLRATPFKSFMKNIRTPLHDHSRKNKGESDTQVVTKFTIIQIILSIASVMIAMMIFG